MDVTFVGLFHICLRLAKLLFTTYSKQYIYIGIVRNIKTI